jgi:ankyrin repeat protein
LHKKGGETIKFHPSISFAMESLLLKAAAEGNTEVIANILDLHQHLVHCRDTDDDTPLHLAVNNHHFDAVKKLLQYGAPVDATGCSCRTPLHCAVIKNLFDCTKILLEYQSSIGEEDSLNETVFHKAATNGSEVMIALLLSVIESQSEKQTIINHPNVLGKLYCKNVSNTTFIIQGCTALHNAAHVGSIQVIKMLVANTADPFLQDNFGYTAYDVAFNRGNLECAEYLKNVMIHHLEQQDIQAQFDMDSVT